MAPKPRRIRNHRAIQAARRPRCEVCGNTWSLQVHHIRSRGAGGDDLPENLICLCVECHTKVHAGQISRETLCGIVRRREYGYCHS